LEEKILLEGQKISILKQNVVWYNKPSVHKINFYHIGKGGRQKMKPGPALDSGQVKRRFGMAEFLSSAAERH
jgi:hypothetical protein